MPPKIKRPGEAPRAPKRRAVWPLLLLVMVALAGALTLTLAVAPKNRAPAGEPVLEPPPGTSALLDGLKPGDTLGSYRVHVLRIIDGQLGIDLIQGEHVITVWVALKGSRPSVPPRETERYSRTERVHGSFHRRFALPDSADPEGITATGHNGVLQITIPKRPETTPRRIQVGSTLHS